MLSEFRVGWREIVQTVAECVDVESGTSGHDYCVVFLEKLFEECHCVQFEHPCSVGLLHGTARYEMVLHAAQSLFFGACHAYGHFLENLAGIAVDYLSAQAFCEADSIIRLSHGCGTENYRQFF